MKKFLYWGDADGQNYKVFAYRYFEFATTTLGDEYIASLLPMAKIAGVTDIWGDGSTRFDVNLNDDLTFHSFVL